jgi:hypothetical protein
MLQDGKCVLTPSKSIYRVYDRPEFLRKSILKEAQYQLDAAIENGLKVQWLVSDEIAVGQLQKFFIEHNLNIEVKFFPE